MFYDRESDGFSTDEILGILQPFLKNYFFRSAVALEGGYYYVDKTRLIRELLDGCGSVNLITRPRRFGKSLNMDMLRSFFEIGTDPSL